MGTSGVKRTPRLGRRNGGPDGGQGGSEATPELSVEDVDTAMRIVLPLLPDGSAKMPIYCAAYEAVYFAYQWKEHGLEHAARDSGRRISKEYLVPTVVNGSWERISEHSPQTPLTAYAEKAYKRTMSQILNHGVDALADYQ